MKEESKNSARDRGCVRTGRGHTTYVWEQQDNRWRQQMETSATGSNVGELEAGDVQASVGHTTSIPSRCEGGDLFKKKDDSHVVHLNFVKKKTGTILEVDPGTCGAVVQ